MAAVLSGTIRWAVIAAAMFLLVACKGDPNEVIVYTSVDQHYSEPLFDAFEAKTGIKVRAVYDVEAAKTTGLANRLIAEAANPQADVFWNGEVMQMPRLAHEGIFATDNWVEFGGRGRVLIVNTDQLGDRVAPSSISDLASANRLGGHIAIAYPMFGTTATHAAALGGLWGEDATLAYFSTLQQNGVRFVAGNSVVRDLVASGQALFGLTDMDDACSAVLRGDPVAVIVPDQEAGGLGALVIPNSAALVRDTENAQRFIDFLTSPQAQTLLVDAGWFHVVGNRIVSDAGCGLPETLRLMPLGFPDDLATFQQKLRAVIVQ